VGSCISRRSRPRAFFTSATPNALRAAELVVPEAVLSGLCDEIADKANTRGWCDCRLPGPAIGAVTK
jgi:hypothetical protein